MQSQESLWILFLPGLWFENLRSSNFGPSNFKSQPVQEQNPWIFLILHQLCTWSEKSRDSRKWITNWCVQNCDDWMWPVRGLPQFFFYDCAWPIRESFFCIRRAWFLSIRMLQFRRRFRLFSTPTSLQHSTLSPPPLFPWDNFLKHVGIVIPGLTLNTSPSHSMTAFLNFLSSVIEWECCPFMSAPGTGCGLK